MRTSFSRPLLLAVLAGVVVAGGAVYAALGAPAWTATFAAAEESPETTVEPTYCATPQGPTPTWDPGCEPSTDATPTGSTPTGPTPPPTTDPVAF